MTVKVYTCTKKLDCATKISSNGHRSSRIKMTSSQNWSITQLPDDFLELTKHLLELFTR